MDGWMPWMDEQTSERVSGKGFSLLNSVYG